MKITQFDVLRRLDHQGLLTSNHQQTSATESFDTAITAAYTFKESDYLSALLELEQEVALIGAFYAEMALEEL